MLDKLIFKIIPFDEWRRMIATLWLMDGSYGFIPPIINGYGQMQYCGKEVFRRIVLFPIAAEYEGEQVGWTSIYNISDEAVRVRGIYVLPEFRSSGVGFRMSNYAMSLWPAPWKYCFMYARSSNLDRYLRWGFTVPPAHKMRTWDYGRRMNEGQIILVHKRLRA